MGCDLPQKELKKMEETESLVNGKMLVIGFKDDYPKAYDFVRNVYAITIENETIKLHIEDEKPIIYPINSIRTIY